MFYLNIPLKNLVSTIAIKKYIKFDVYIHIVKKKYKNILSLLYSTT